MCVTLLLPELQLPQQLRKQMQLNAGKLMTYAAIHLLNCSSNHNPNQQNKTCYTQLSKLPRLLTAGVFLLVLMPNTIAEAMMRVMSMMADVMAVMMVALADMADMMKMTPVMIETVTTMTMMTNMTAKTITATIGGMTGNAAMAVPTMATMVVSMMAMTEISMMAMIEILTMATTEILMTAMAGITVKRVMEGAMMASNGATSMLTPPNLMSTEVNQNNMADTSSKVGLQESLIYCESLTYELECLCKAPIEVVDNNNNLLVPFDRNVEGVNYSLVVPLDISWDDFEWEISRKLKTLPPDVSLLYKLASQIKAEMARDVVNEKDLEDLMWRCKPFVDGMKKCGRGKEFCVQLFPRIVASKDAPVPTPTQKV